MGLAFWRSKKRTASAGGKPASRPPLSQDDSRSAARSGRGLARAGAASTDRRVGPAAGRCHHRADGARSQPQAGEREHPDRHPERAHAVHAAPVAAPGARRRRRHASARPRACLRHPPRRSRSRTSGSKQGQKRRRRRPRSRSRLSESKAAAKTEAKTDEAKPAKVEVARKASEPPATAAPASKAGKFAVQAAAPASEKAARELVERLKKGGFTTYTEKVETKDGVRHRVRIGPYATLEDAEKARARLKAQGINGNLVRSEVSVPTVDWIIAFVFLVSVLVGLLRGVTREIVSLAGWVIGLVLAYFFAEQVGAMLPIEPPTLAEPCSARC